MRFVSHVRPLHNLRPPRATMNRTSLSGLDLVHQLRFRMSTNFFVLICNDININMVYWHPLTYPSFTFWMVWTIQCAIKQLKFISIIIHQQQFQMRLCGSFGHFEAEPPMPSVHLNLTKIPVVWTNKYVTI